MHGRTCKCALSIGSVPQLQGLKLGSWQDVRYKGDWMRRPLSSSEIGWLVRLLLLISDIFNACFHLDQPLPAEATPTVSLEVGLNGIATPPCI